MTSSHSEVPWALLWLVSAPPLAAPLAPRSVGGHGCQAGVPPPTRRTHHIEGLQVSPKIQRRFQGGSCLVADALTLSRHIGII